MLDPGRPAFLHAEGTVFPCIVREWGDARDVAGPYGFGGPVGEAAFYDAYEAWCREQGVVTTFTWFHPRFANHRYTRFHVEPRGGTVAWRLDEGDLFERLHRHHRRAARKAEASGIEVRITVAPSDLEPFARLYERTMAEKGAESFYYFPPEYWPALAERLGDALVLFEAIAGRRAQGRAARPRELTLAPLPPRSLRAVGRREQPPLPRGRALGARTGVHPFPPRRRRRRRGRLAAGVQAPLRRGRPDRVGGRQGDPRRGRLPRARRRGLRRLLPRLPRG